MMRVPRRVLVFPAILTLMAGCGTVPGQADVPAVLVKPNAESRAELLRAVSAALNGASVTLADDAFTRKNSLSIERKAARDASGLPVQGRELGRPEQFRLVISGSDCVLVHEGSGRRLKLANVACTRSNQPGGTT